MGRLLVLVGELGCGEIFGMSTSEEGLGSMETLELVYEFAGRHLVASYLGCDPDKLNDNVGLMDAMRRAITACGATLLSFKEHIFESGGLTAVMLLSESHASIHTYPEHSACFVDIFTCGTTCNPLIFDSVLRDYLQPTNVSCKELIRDNTVCFAPDAQESTDNVMHAVFSPSFGLSAITK